MHDRASDVIADVPLPGALADAIQHFGADARVAVFPVALQQRLHILFSEEHTPYLLFQDLLIS